MSAVNRGITHSYSEKSREAENNMPGSGSTKEGKRGRISPLHLAARGIIQTIPQELGEAYPADVCQRDRLQLQIACPKGLPSTFTYDTH